MSTPSGFSRSSRSGCSPTPMAPSRLCRGVRRARCASSMGCWIGLATNDAEMSARQQLTGLGWLHRFESVIGYDSGFGAKPGPGMLLESAERPESNRRNSRARRRHRHGSAHGRAAGCRVSWSMRRLVRSSRRCTWRRWPSCRRCSPESCRPGGCATMRACSPDAASARPATPAAAPCAERQPRGRRRRGGWWFHRAVDGLLPEAARSVSLGGRGRASSCRLRCVGSQRRRVVAEFACGLDKYANVEPRRGISARS